MQHACCWWVLLCQFFMGASGFHRQHDAVDAARWQARQARWCSLSGGVLAAKLAVQASSAGRRSRAGWCSVSTTAAPVSAFCFRRWWYRCCSPVRRQANAEMATPWRGRGGCLRSCAHWPRSHWCDRYLLCARSSHRAAPWRAMGEVFATVTSRLGLQVTGALALAISAT